MDKGVTMVPDLRVVSQPSRLGESPFWHPEQRCLFWCDIAGRQLHRLDPLTGATRSWSFKSEPACCAPALGGEIVLGMRDGVWRLQPQGGDLHRVHPAPYDPTKERFNDGKCDPQGRFWVGTVYEPREPALAALYCSDGITLERRANGVTTANGLAWSPDSRTMYWADTRAHTVFAFDFDPQDGGLSRRRVFASFPARDAADGAAPYGGRPDGAAVDVEGCYWVAMYEGRRLLRLAPDGSVLGQVVLPVTCPTMPCFGGPDLRTLFVTTARGGRSAEELGREPMAGCVLAMTVDVPGLPVNFCR